MLLELEPVGEQVAAAWQEEDAVVEVDTSNVAVAVVAVEEVRIACVAPQERPVLAPFVVVAVQDQQKKLFAFEEEEVLLLEMFAFYISSLMLFDF